MKLAERLDRIEKFSTPQIFKSLQHPDMISFAGGVPDPALFDVEGIGESIQRVLTDALPAALQYGVAQGLPILRAQLSRHMGDRGMVVGPEQILVTSGGQQALDLAAKILITPGDEVLVEAPTFIAAIESFRLYGAQVIGLPVDHDGIDVDMLEAQLGLGRTKLIYLVPTFGNPGGSTLSLQRRLKVLELAERYGTFLIEDDPYSDLYFGNAPPPDSLFALAQQHGLSTERIVYCGTLSKIVSPGLRVGWLAISAKELLDNAIKCKLLSDTHSNALGQAVVADYLDSGRLPETLVKSRRIYRERATVMAEALESCLKGVVTFRRPGGGLFVWARLASKWIADSDALSTRAFHRAVAILPGSLFYATAPDSTTFRLSFASVSESRIHQGVVRLRDALTDH